MYDCVRELFERNRLTGKDIDFLVVNCSLFCPTPSLSAMVCLSQERIKEARTEKKGSSSCRLKELMHNMKAKQEEGGDFHNCMNECMDESAQSDHF